MKKSKIGFWLLAIAYLASVWLAVARMIRPAVDDRVTIRIAHWQLEAGVREAMNAVIADYEKLHPKVKVEQLVIPDTMYKQWLQAQLAGGNCPELIEYGSWYGRVGELQAKYFTPLDTYLSQPNQYNAGTPLEGVPWRQTFVDGLENFDCYNQQMNQFFGISFCIGSFRIFYNRTLYKEITGRDDPPADIRDFLKVSAQIKAYARENNQPIVPVAGSKMTIEHMGGAMLDAMAMKKVYGMDYLHRLRLDHLEIGLAHLRGEWTYRDPEIMGALALVRAYCEQLDPGSTQLERDSATMKFSNGRAVMIGTGSFDASSLKLICPFEVGAFRVPMPTVDDPEYGKYMLDFLAEGRANTGFAFYALRQSPNREQALDFMRYLTSLKGSQHFADRSGWLSGIVGAKPTEYSKQYMPVFDGYSTTAVIPLLTGPDASELFKKNSYLITSHSGSPEQFADAMEAGLRGRIFSDMNRVTRDMLRNQNQQDVALAARHVLSLAGVDKTRDLGSENSSSTLTEAKVYRYMNEVWRAEKKTP